MANIQKIFTGMSQGPETIDNNFNAINTELQNVDGVINNLQWSNFTDEGIVYENGFYKADQGGQGATGYRYLKIGGLKLVEFQAALRLSTDPGESVNTVTALQLPQYVYPIDMGAPRMQDQNYIINFADGRVDIEKVSKDWWVGSNSSYIVHALYTSSI